MLESALIFVSAEGATAPNLRPVPHTVGAAVALGYAKASDNKAEYRTSVEGVMVPSLGPVPRTVDAAVAPTHAMAPGEEAEPRAGGCRRYGSTWLESDTIYE